MFYQVYIRVRAKVMVIGRLIKKVKLKVRLGLDLGDGEV